MNEKFGLGVAFNSVSAAAMEYKSGNPSANDFVGRYWATEVDLVTITLTPSLAWRINEQWSVGFGVPIQFARLDLGVAVPAPDSLPAVPLTDGLAQISDGDDVSAAIQLSVPWEEHRDYTWVSPMRVRTSSASAATSPHPVPGAVPCHCRSTVPT